VLLLVGVQVVVAEILALPLVLRPLADMEPAIILQDRMGKTKVVMVEAVVQEAVVIVAATEDHVAVEIRAVKLEWAELLLEH
jgi:hypothetical protein